MDLTYDELDAILRDPHAPGDVRAAVQTELAVRNYCNRVTFNVDSNDVTSVSYRQDDEVGPVSEAPPSSARQQSTADSVTPPAPEPPPAEGTPAPETESPPPPGPEPETSV